MKTFFALALAFACSSVFAASDSQVLVTGAKDKSGSASLIAVDVMTGGEVHAVSLVLAMDGVSDKQVNLSQCTSGLPKSWQGGCSFKSGELRVMAFGPLDAPLPKGLFSIGRVSVTGQVGSATTSLVELADAKGNVISSVSDVEI